MIIDFHTHSFPESISKRVMKTLSGSVNLNPFTDGTYLGLRRSMVLSGVDVSIVLPIATTKEQTKTINKTAIERNRDFSETGILSCGSVHPDNKDYRNILKDLKEQGIKGIKIHPVFQDVPIDDVRFMDLIYEASAQGFVVITHAGNDISYPGRDEASINRIDRMLTEVKPEKMVLAHMGGFGEWHNVADILIKHRVYVDTSFSLLKPDYSDSEHIWKEEDVRISGDYAIDIIRAVGTNRILFGSDSPWLSQRDSIKVLSDYFRGDGLSKVLGINAKMLLNI